MNWLLRVLDRSKREAVAAADSRLARRQKAVLERGNKALGGDPLLEKLIKEADLAIFGKPER